MLPVAVIGGSDGGVRDEEPTFLRHGGLNAFPVPYWGVGNLPETLAEIPLEYFATVLARHGIVNVVASSRGTEAALLLAQYFPKLLSKVVLISPSHVAWSSDKPAWTYKGIPIPSLQMEGTPEQRDGHLVYRDSFERSLRNPTAETLARIPVQNVEAEFLLIAGADDQIWPSDLSTIELEKSLNAAGAKVEALVLPGVGHGIPLPGTIPQTHFPHPQTGEHLLSGGSIDSIAEASTRVWKRITKFLGGDFDLAVARSLPR